MINCAPTTRIRLEDNKKNSSLNLQAPCLQRMLLCLLAVFFCTIPILHGSATASFDSQLPHQNPFLFSGKTNLSTPNGNGYTETGLASWYGQEFQGRRTSSGERYNMHELTAAHKILPMDTLLLVKNLENGKEVVVRVNDRGPFVKGRILDLSQGAATALKLMGKGTARVKVVAMSGVRELLRPPPQDKSFDESAGNFYIQVGAFVNEKNAEQMQRRFASTAFTAIIDKVTGKKATIHRVLVFAGKDRQTALLAQKTLQQKGHKGAFVMAL